MATKQYEPPLRLVTPPMRGQAVKDAQWLLQGHNRFDGLATLKDGPRDGVYGPVTAAATARAKYWLGYPQSACTKIFGQTLYEYLREKQWRPLPDAYRKRRAERLAMAARTPGEDALDFAVGQLGTREEPFGSNCQKYGAWYGWNCVAWCGIFVSYCFHHTGYTRFRYPYVPTLTSDIRNGRNNLRQVWTPRPGDIVCFTVNGTPSAHVAFFHSWGNRDAGNFWDLGGNTGPSSMSNGGSVAKQLRDLSQVTVFGRVG